MGQRAVECPAPRLFRRRATLTFPLDRPDAVKQCQPSKAASWLYPSQGIACSRNSHTPFDRRFRGVDDRVETMGGRVRRFPTRIIHRPLGAALCLGENAPPFKETV